jgi:hypothetical protein
VQSGREYVRDVHIKIPAAWNLCQMGGETCLALI